MHRHECWSCRDLWWHEEDGDEDEGCAGLALMACPEHRGEPAEEPWYVQRRPLGVPS